MNTNHVTLQRMKELLTKNLEELDEMKKNMKARLSELDTMLQEESSSQEEVQSPPTMSPLVSRRDAKVWMGMHHPEWVVNSAHPEEEALIASREYWTYAKNKAASTTLANMCVGDEFIIRVKTGIGVGGGRLARGRDKGYLRKGIITHAPVIAPQTFDLIKDWYVTKIDWDPIKYPLNPNYKVGSCLVIREQK